MYHEEIILQLSAQLGSTITVSAAKIRELIEFEDELAQVSVNYVLLFLYFIMAVLDQQQRSKQTIKLYQNTGKKLE